MRDLNILWLTRKGDGYVGAPQTQYGFEQEVAKQCNCIFAGEGHPLHRVEESIDLTVKRVMPNADWVIDYDNHLHEKVPKNRSYKVGHFISDLHAKHFYDIRSPIKYVELLNSVGYDAIFMRYKLIYGTCYRPDVVHDLIKCNKHWVPWSVDDDWFTPTRKKTDVAFIGTIGKCYPLREDIWNGLYYVTRGYKIIRETSPQGTTYEREISRFIETHLVGERYRDALAETRILLFGCSIYRYPLQKFFEGSSSQCLIVSNEPGGAKSLGFVNGETYVSVNIGDWEEKLLYLLDNPDVIKMITRAGMKNVLMNHSHETRAEEFLEVLEK